MTIAIYTTSGVRLDRRGKQLTVEQIHAYPHRSVVRVEPGAEVARVWLLEDGATLSSLSPKLARDTIDYLVGGVAVLLLSHRLKTIQMVQRCLMVATVFGGPPAVKHAARDKVRREIAA